MVDESGESMELMEDGTKSTGYGRVGDISAGFTERSREMIPETRGSILEGTIFHS